MNVECRSIHCFGELAKMEEMFIKMKPKLSLEEYSFKPYVTYDKAVICNF